jgi:hypothetical protein
LILDGCDYASDPSNRRYQFDLKTLLLTTTVVGVLLGLLSRGWLGMLFLVLVIGGAGLLVWELFMGRASTSWAAGICGIALTYTVANLIGFMIVLRIDKFLILDWAYWIVVVLVCPGLIGSLVVLIALFNNQVTWKSVAGFIGWWVAVAMANDYIIDVAAASV